MATADFDLEKTSSGLQYIIPGAERIVKPTPQKYPIDKMSNGDQLVIPGAEHISMREHILRLAERPMSPRHRQIGLKGIGLF